MPKRQTSKRKYGSVIRWDEVHELTTFSRVHILNLEKSGKFPKRLQLGPNRVGWRLEDVLEWLAKRERGPLSR